MIGLPCPDFLVDDVVADCIGVRKNEGLRKRLIGAANDFIQAERVYKEKGVSSSFFEIDPSGIVSGLVSSGEMENLYSGVFVKSPSIRRKYYDKLKLLPENGICPFCGQREVSTLDHYLPKAKHPRLAVTPVNLIPACKDCNHKKGEHSPETRGSQFIHPYFDRVSNDIWLVADVVEDKPPALIFRVSAPEHFDRELTSRLGWHFSELGLGRLYVAQAGRTLSGMAAKLRRAWSRGGEREVRFLLQEEAISWSEYQPNCWQAAMYRALADSEWFCGEGYEYAGERVT